MNAATPNPSMSGATVASARLAWGDLLPDWVLVLAEECDRLKSQRRAGTLLGYGASTVNQVIKNSYAGDMSKIEAKVRGRFMGVSVECPVFGEIAKDRCFNLQAQKLAGVGSNPERVKVYRACRGGCPHSRLPKEAAHG